MTGAISEILDEKILVLMITFVFCGGCGDNSTGSKQADPLVGIWEYEGFEDGDGSVIFIFYDDGRFKWTGSKGSDSFVVQGTWEKKSSIPPWWATPYDDACGGGELKLRSNELTIDGENQSIENPTTTVSYSIREDRLTLVIDGESLALSRA